MWSRISKVKVKWERWFESGFNALHISSGSLMPAIYIQYNYQRFNFFFILPFRRLFIPFRGSVVHLISFPNTVLGCGGLWKRGWGQGITMSAQHRDVCQPSAMDDGIVYQPNPNIQWEKKIFDPLLILYVCPLTKKWSVYNFNGRFILTVRDRITTKKSRKKHLKKVINLHFTYNLVPDILGQLFGLGHGGEFGIWLIDCFCGQVSFIQVTNWA